MSELEQRLEKDYLESVKSRNQERVGTLRLLKSALKNEQIAKKEALVEADIIQIIKREAKRRREAMAIYKKGERPDLEAQEEAELKIIQEYLPPEMSDEELKQIVAQVIKDNKLAGQQNFGQAMKLVITEVKGQVDGIKVTQVVKELLLPPAEINS